MTETIPGPKGLPIIGNMLDLRHEEGLLRAIEGLAEIYGPVHQVTFAGRKLINITSAELLLLCTDEKQFEKTPPPALDGQAGARGLFLARSDDPDWGQAHRILVPAMGPLSVEGMFDGMKDIAHQLVLKWARDSENKEILITDDFTRLTLDTIALCAMDYRFNSFYHDDMHPFVEAMLGFLEYAGVRSTRPQFYTKYFAGKENAKFAENAKTMDSIAREVIERRKQSSVVKDDLLNYMLTAKDPKTGEPMRDELVIAQMITFLIAGHETTSGLLSFAMMSLMQNPRAYLEAQKEVDEVIGKEAVTLKQVKELKYINAILRETLRLYPTAPVLSKQLPKSRHDEYVTIADGKYHIENDHIIRLLLSKCMQDPSYFGEDATEFMPERMHEDNPNFAYYMKAWKPFGNGARSCIGQSFAWQEAVLVIALVLQNFEVTMANPDWRFAVKQALTVKPKDLYVKVRLRQGLDATILDHRLHSGQLQSQSTNASPKTVEKGPSAKKSTAIQILYGTNSGTCSALAQKLASYLAIRHGVKATVRDLDAAVNDLSDLQSLIIITSSYEGQPPDNAARFVEWVQSSTFKYSSGLKYAVFGCGNKDWHETYQRIPKLLDHLLEEHGAERMLEIGTADVSQGGVLDQFEIWQANLLERLQDTALSSKQEGSSELAEIQTDQRASKLSSGLTPVKVKDVKVLTSPGRPEKRHIEVELPADTVYEAGDYLAVLPLNPDQLVNRILKHWSLPQDATITLKTGAFGSLHTNVPLSVKGLLEGFFELSQPVSKSDIRSSREYTEDKDVLSKLQVLTTDDVLFQKMVSEKHMSLFNFLEFFGQIKMPFANFLASLMPLRVRQYSISSSPLASPSTCTITYSVVSHQSGSGTSLGNVHEGVASTYLSKLLPGDTIQIAVKTTATANKPCVFRLPDSRVQESTPLLMFCAGTGLAPFRGFIQHRALMLQQNPSLKLAPALLFIGCRTSKADRLYATEFDEWQKLGAVDLRYAFSQEPEDKLAAGCKYIAERVLKDMADIRASWRVGCKIYVCGSRKVQDSLREAVSQIFEEIAKQEQWDKPTLQGKVQVFRAALAQRAASDIFD